MVIVTDSEEKVSSKAIKHFIKRELLIGKALAARRAVGVE